MTVLRIILADHLSHTISSLENLNREQDIIFMCESLDQSVYVRHHKKKIAFIFSAMRHFHLELQEKGVKTHYVAYENPENSKELEKEILKAISYYSISKIIITEPSEYEILQNVKKWNQSFHIPVEIYSDYRFLCSKEAFQLWAKDYKNLRMEFFYRNMRVKYDILMEGQVPAGGEWNYDADNRKPFKKNVKIPHHYQLTPDAITQDVLKVVHHHFQDHFGDLEPFYFAVTRKDALLILDHFIENCLPYFGEYQDAMVESQPWMFHSHISFYLNCGLLLPLECIERAEEAYYEKKAPLNSVEGFIRQIMGWREYVRGIYWLKMPYYKSQNFLNAQEKLPNFYWWGNTDMNCLRQCVLETKKNAYAHHIQRLMVLGNFALLIGVHPDEVNEWFLIVYADAYEWVELPNVSGMILFADGGYLGSKPYAAGGSYINKMSNYCQNCTYNVKEKHGSQACPFNYLYWNFLERNKEKLSGNPRMSMMYATYEKMDSQKKDLIREDSRKFLEEIKTI